MSNRERQPEEREGRHFPDLLFQQARASKPSNTLGVTLIYVFTGLGFRVVFVGNTRRRELVCYAAFTTISLTYREQLGDLCTHSYFE